MSLFHYKFFYIKSNLIFLKITKIMLNIIKTKFLFKIWEKIAKILKLKTTTIKRKTFFKQN